MSPPRRPRKARRAPRPRRRKSLLARLRNLGHGRPAQRALRTSRERARRASEEGVRASRDGVRATAKAAREPARRTRRGLGRGLAALGGLLAQIVKTLSRRAGKLATRAARLAGRGIDTASRRVRPEHVVGAVALAASVLLVASQFSDYRGVGVGSPAYAGLENVVTAPETAKQTPIDAHWYLLLVAAAASLALLYMVLVRRRWLLGRAISAIGLAAIAISLAVDIPQGLDTGQTSKIFAGAKAVLLGGFWVELFASALLVLSGMLLASYGRGAAAPARQRRRPAQRRTPRTTPDRSSRLAEGST